MTPSRPRGILLATVAAVVWGTVPIAGTVALGGISAGLLSTTRLLTAAGFLALVLRRRHARLGRPSAVLGWAAVALAGNYVCYMWGVERAGAATSQVLIQTAPLFLVILGVIVLGERLAPRQIAGTVAALGGVALVSWDETPSARAHAAGVGLIIAAALSWAVYGVLHKHIGRDHASGPTMMWIFLVSGVLLAPVGVIEPARSADGVELAAIAYLCMNTIVAYWCFAESLRHIPASLAGVIATLGPVITFGLLAITNRLDQKRVPLEPITAMKLGGAALVMAGVATAVRRSRSQRPSH